MSGQVIGVSWPDHVRAGKGKKAAVAVTAELWRNPSAPRRGRAEDEAEEGRQLGKQVGPRGREGVRRKKMTARGRRDVRTRERVRRLKMTNGYDEETHPYRKVGL
jgi:hypothetical protein